MDDNQSDEIIWTGANQSLTREDIVAFDAARKEWVNQYLSVPWHDSFEIGDDCEYREARAGREWAAAQVVDYVIEDRPYYVVKYVDYFGRMREKKVGGSELRKLREKGLDTEAQGDQYTTI